MFNPVPRRLHTYDRAQLQQPTATPEKTVAPVRLLVISDDPQRLAYWRNALPGKQWEVTGMAAAPWLSHFRRSNYDLVVVDVAAPQLTEVLDTIRAADMQIPLLVEASRLPNDLSYAGVLPRYRAMPCPQADLLRLVKHSFAPVAAVAPARRLL